MSKTRNLANSAPQFNSLIVPTGNTTQRPVVTAGQIRFNTDLGTLESANGVYWANVGSGSASSSAANLTSLTGNVYISAAGGIVDSSNAVGGLVLPSGNTAQRPATIANGSIRWNTTSNVIEIKANSNWYSPVLNTSGILTGNLTINGGANTTSTNIGGEGNGI